MIRLVQWSPRAHKFLLAVEGLDIADVQREVLAGISQLWECSRDADGLCGYVVTRLELHGSGREWVWVACAGKHFDEFVQAFVLTAQQNSLPVRVYVRRPGMKRIYERLGFQTDATVMRLARWAS